MRPALIALVVAVSACSCHSQRPAGTTSRPSASAAPNAPAVTDAPAPETPAATPSPARAACHYSFPVQPLSVASYGRYHHDYPATDIFAPRGSRFVAPTSGIVDFTSRTDHWDSKTDDASQRGGISVAIVGDDGVRYYGSHLLDVARGVTAGVRVDAGTLLGHVDTTGNARGIKPHLHFGISHPTTPDDWKVRRGEVNPYESLEAWKDGRMVRPQVPGSRAPSCVPENA